jgi:hypothetical protein
MGAYCNYHHVNLKYVLHSDDWLPWQQLNNTQFNLDEDLRFDKVTEYQNISNFENNNPQSELKRTNR